MKPKRVNPFTLAAHLRAADGTKVSYPIRADLPAYERVPILTVGEYHPHGVAKWTVDSNLLQTFAANYDPNFYAATLNCDHWDFMGPASGLILRLEADGDTLYADLVNVDPWLAYQIDMGQWPHRSVEWWQESILGEKFYGKFDNYITGLGLLGVDSPAVPGLGPMPERATPADDLQPVEVRTVPYVNPLAARALHARALHLISSKEVAVDDDPDTETNPNVNVPPPEGSGAPTTLQAANTMIADLQAQLASKGNGADDAQTDALRAALGLIQNLQTELQTKSQRERESIVEALVTQKVTAGVITAAQADDYRSLALMFHEAQGVQLSASQAVNFTEATQPLALIDKLLANQPKAPMTAHAQGSFNAPAGNANLSATEATIAASLGKAGLHDDAKIVAQGGTA